MTELLLSAKNITKRFGGLAAVSDISVDLWRGKIHAVIGTNGAGKSTLANLLSGDLQPTSGKVTLGGTDVTGWKPEKISRAGLGRSYQKTNIFLPLTVWDNVHLAAQSRTPNAWSWLKTAASVQLVSQRTVSGNRYSAAAQAEVADGERIVGLGVARIDPTGTLEPLNRLGGAAQRLEDAGDEANRRDAALVEAIGLLKRAEREVGVLGLLVELAEVEERGDVAAAGVDDALVGRGGLFGATGGLLCGR